MVVCRKVGVGHPQNARGMQLHNRFRKITGSNLTSILDVNLMDAISLRFLPNEPNCPILIA